MRPPGFGSLNDSRLSVAGGTLRGSLAAGVLVTPLNCPPCQKVEHHLGPLTIHLIKETNAVREAGGVHNFVQLFISEVGVSICDGSWSLQGLSKRQKKMGTA